MNPGSFVLEASAAVGACVSRSVRAPLQLARLNILVHAEEIVRIVFLLNRGKPLIIVAVGFFHAVFAFIAHQKIYVRAAGGIWMNGIVVTLRP